MVGDDSFEKLLEKKAGAQTVKQNSVLILPLDSLKTAYTIIIRALLIKILNSGDLRSSLMTHRWVTFFVLWKKNRKPEKTWNRLKHVWINHRVKRWGHAARSPKIGVFDQKTGHFKFVFFRNFSSKNFFFSNLAQFRDKIKYVQPRALIDSCTVLRWAMKNR